MFNVLMADGSHMEFNKNCYQNNYQALIRAHNEKWNATRDARRIFECKLTKIKFAKAEDLVTH